MSDSAASNSARQWLQNLIDSQGGGSRGLPAVRGQQSPSTLRWQTPNYGAMSMKQPQLEAPTIEGNLAAEHSLSGPAPASGSGAASGAFANLLARVLGRAGGAAAGAVYPSNPTNQGEDALIAQQRAADSRLPPGATQPTSPIAASLMGGGVGQGAPAPRQQWQSNIAGDVNGGTGAAMPTPPGAPGTTAADPAAPAGGSDPNLSPFEAARQLAIAHGLPVFTYNGQVYTVNAPAQSGDGGAAEAAPPAAPPPPPAARNQSPRRAAAPNMPAPVPQMPVAMADRLQGGFPNDRSMTLPPPVRPPAPAVNPMQQLQDRFEGARAG